MLTKDKLQLTQSVIPRLNEVAIWEKTAGADELDIRPYRGRYNFTEGGIIRQPGRGQVYRYVKNYRRGKTEYSLLMVTRDHNAAKVGLFLDKCAKELKSPKPDRFVSYLGVSYVSS